MMSTLLTQDDAIARLQQACDDAGGVGDLADKVGVSISYVSQLLHGHKPINGKVAKHLKLKLQRETTIAYERVEE